MATKRPKNPLVEQFRRGCAARDLRLMAAQGLLPLKPEDLLELWTALVSDADDAVRAAAGESLKAFPALELLPIVKNRETPEGVLSWAVSSRPEPELREAALQNHSLPDETIEQLAATLPQALAELVVINQTRLLRRTSLLVALEANAGLSNDQKRRLRELRELRETFKIDRTVPDAVRRGGRGIVTMMLGIDPGTTKSCVAAIEDGVPRVILNQEGERTTRSVMAFAATGERLVGGPADRQALTNVDGTVNAVLRLVGRRFRSRDAANARRSTLCPLVEGPNGDVQVRLGNKSYSTTEILSFLLSDLKASAEDSLGESIAAAVITCPATFYDAQRRAIKEAGFMAGLETVSLVNATTAAALAYQAETKARRGFVAVFHLGGGTFDISIVEFARGLCKVRSRAGDSFLGGEDFDWCIVDWLIEQFSRDCGIDLGADGMTLRRIKEAAERAKRELSTAQQTKISLPFIHTNPSGPRHLSVLLTRGKYEALTRDLLERLAQLCRQCLADADLEVDQIDEVVLVGGQTRAPRVRQLARGLFGREPSRVIDPEWGIAIGAAIQASRLAREQQDDTLLDVTPFTLGIEGEDGTFTRIIERNASIPTHRRQVLITGTDYQTRMAVHVLQGESDRPAENESLGQLEFTDIPSAPAGEAYLEVDFDIDEDGIVSVESLSHGAAETKVGAETEARLEFRGKVPTESHSHADERWSARAVELYRELVRARLSAGTCTACGASLAAALLVRTDTRVGPELNELGLSDAGAASYLAATDALVVTCGKCGARNDVAPGK